MICPDESLKMGVPRKRRIQSWKNPSTHSEVPAVSSWGCVWPNYVTVLSQMVVLGKYKARWNRLAKENSRVNDWNFPEKVDMLIHVGQISSSPGRSTNNGWFNVCVSIGFHGGKKQVKLIMTWSGTAREFMIMGIYRGRSPPQYHRKPEEIAGLIKLCNWRSYQGIWKANKPLHYLEN